MTLSKGPFENIEKKRDKSTACGCQHLAVGCLKEDKKSKKGHNSEIKCILNCLPICSIDGSLNSEHIIRVLTHSDTITPFDAPG